MAALAARFLIFSKEPKEIEKSKKCPFGVPENMMDLWWLKN